MKRYRPVCRGDDQLIKAEKRQKIPNGSNDATYTKSSTKSHDGRLSLLTLVCNQELSSRSNDGPHGHAGMIPRKFSVRNTKTNNRKHGSVSKNSERVLGIMAPVVISPSEDDNTGEQKPLLADSEVSGIIRNLSRNRAQKQMTSAKVDPVDGNGKRKTPFVWRDVCRPVPCPPRLPMVPAGYIFPLAKAPTRISCLET